jgi:hypothetical protein
VIRQPNAAVGTGVHARCLRHREGHSRGHWSVCDGHEAVGIPAPSQAKSTSLSIDSDFTRVSQILSEVEELKEQ